MIRFYLTLILVAYPLVASADVDVVFGPSPDLPATIVKTIGDATWTLDIAVYGLDHPKVIEAIKQASEDGVRVRLLLNDAHKSPKVADKLENAGVDVRRVNQTLHHKFLVSDSRTLMTGSCNWTKTSFSSYDEDLLTFKNEPAYVDAFRSEFEKLWSCSKEYGKTVFEPTILLRTKTSGFGRALFTSANMTTKQRKGEPILSSNCELEDGICGLELIKAINNAENTIDVATTHFRREDIAKALELAVGRGVSVRILLDMQEYHPATTEMSNSLFDEGLDAIGAKVRYKCYLNEWTYQRALQMHCKYMIVDDRTVFTGSLNWSANSELKSIENLIRLDRPELTRKYKSRFNMKWNYGNGTFPDILRTLNNESDEPIRFEPISLTGDQVSRIVQP